MQQIMEYNINRWRTNNNNTNVEEKQENNISEEGSFPFYEIIHNESNHSDNNLHHFVENELEIIGDNWIPFDIGIQSDSHFIDEAIDRVVNEFGNDTDVTMDIDHLSVYFDKFTEETDISEVANFIQTMTGVGNVTFYSSNIFSDGQKWSVRKENKYLLE